MFPLSCRLVALEKENWQWFDGVYPESFHFAQDRSVEGLIQV
jgi:hypothetical protein